MDDSIPFRTVVKITLSILGLIVILMYVIFQARFLIGSPQITLDSELPITQNQRQIFLTGDTHNISHLWLNDRPIYTDVNGNFNEALVLENGYTITTLRAEDRYGRETIITRPFVYTPASFNQ